MKNLDSLPPPGRSRRYLHFCIAVTHRDVAPVLHHILQQLSCRGCPEQGWVCLFFKVTAFVANCDAVSGGQKPENEEAIKRKKYKNVVGCLGPCFFQSSSPTGHFPGPLVPYRKDSCSSSPSQRLRNGCAMEGSGFVRSGIHSKCELLCIAGRRPISSPTGRFLVSCTWCSCCRCKTGGALRRSAGARRSQCGCRSL